MDSEPIYDPPPEAEWLSRTAIRRLPLGARVLVLGGRSGGWHAATIVESPRARYRGVYSCALFDDPALGWQAGHWNLDEGTQVVLLTDKPTESEGDMSPATTRHEFPTEPVVLTYFDPHRREVPVSHRWLRVKVNSEPKDLLFMGNCLHCNTSTWATKEGVTLDVMGGYSLIVVEDEGRKYRFCRSCGLTEARVDEVIARHKDDNTFTGPLVWPREPFEAKAEVEATEDDLVSEPF